MKIIGGGIIRTQISVYDVETEKITGVQTNEWMDMYLYLGAIVTLKEYKSKQEPHLDGLPQITTNDGNYYLLKELLEDVLEAWQEFQKFQSNKIA
jgi:hypothetical protein